MRRDLCIRIGAICLMLAGAGWCISPFLPWFFSSARLKMLSVGAILLAAEILFWLGLVLAGRGTWDLARRKGWRQVPAALWQVVRTGSQGSQEEDNTFC